MKNDCSSDNRVVTALQAITKKVYKMKCSCSNKEKLLIILSELITMDMKNLFLGMACVLLTGCANSPKQETVTSCCNDKSSMEVILNLHRKVKPEYVSAYKEAFAKCKANTVQEVGCVDYGVYQSPEDSTEFLICEVWENENVLAKHGETAHLKQLLEETKDMFDGASDKKIYVCAEAQK
ncbi:hypothetical protein KGMB02408_02970 [Bacteroides faecalis]|uniref:ABM domain-containing protein n=2 Tax=Bacteroides faecalis TaxID=2447885 RepID=A0A401LP71_9BACE|nr:hypothetical protein KGMB02408_02970 [Bacteroides faecalis]